MDLSHLLRTHSLPSPVTLPPLPADPLSDHECDWPLLLRAARENPARLTLSNNPLLIYMVSCSSLPTLTLSLHTTFSSLFGLFSLKPTAPLWETMSPANKPSGPAAPPPPESTLQPGGTPQAVQGHSHTPTPDTCTPVPPSELGDGSTWQLLAPSASCLRPPLSSEGRSRNGEKEGTAFL